MLIRISSKPKSEEVPDEVLQAMVGIEVNTFSPETLFLGLNGGKTFTERINAHLVKPWDLRRALITAGKTKAAQWLAQKYPTTERIHNHLIVIGKRHATTIK